MTVIAFLAGVCAGILIAAVAIVVAAALMDEENKRGG